MEAGDYTDQDKYWYVVMIVKEKNSKRSRLQIIQFEKFTSALEQLQDFVGKRLDIWLIEKIFMTSKDDYYNVGYIAHTSNKNLAIQKYIEDTFDPSLFYNLDP